MKATDDGETANISVLVRVRPPLSQEVPYGLCTRVEGRRIVFDTSPPAGTGDRRQALGEKQRAKTIECEYDKVLDMTGSQEDVWNAVCPKVEKVLEGYNATVFTYGMTGSGKTFTMLGPKLMSVAWEDEGPKLHEVRECSKRGIVPRVAELLFERLGHGASSARISMSYLQVYRERCYDLLQPATSAQALKVREEVSASTSRSGGAGRVYVEGLSQVSVGSVEECLRKLLYGSSNIAFRSTAYNEQSSRSHVILTLNVQQTLRAQDGLVRQSKLHLVDLAGNERWDTFGPGMSPTHAKELTCINQSLTTLGACIQALSQAPPAPKRDGHPAMVHVPYRNSALTMLLRDSLGGGSFTVMVCTICSCALYQMQSLSTMRFADRAKRVRMRAKINDTVDSKMLLRQTQAEVMYLRSLVAEGGATSDLKKNLEKLEGENKNLKEKVQNLTSERFEIRSYLLARGHSEAQIRNPAVLRGASIGAWQTAEETTQLHGDSASSRAARLRRTNSEPAMTGPDLWFSDPPDNQISFTQSAADLSGPAASGRASGRPPPLAAPLHRKTDDARYRSDAASSGPEAYSSRRDSGFSGVLHAPTTETQVRPSPRRRSISKPVVNSQDADSKEVVRPPQEKTPPAASQPSAKPARCPEGHILVSLDRPCSLPAQQAIQFGIAMHQIARSAARALTLEIFVDSIVPSANTTYASIATAR
jgi:kinesin family protein 3/17